MKSILIKDTTREERMEIVAKALAACGQECEFCNSCENAGIGIDSFYQPYIDGEKEISELNREFHAGIVHG